MPTVDSVDNPDLLAFGREVPPRNFVEAENVVVLVTVDSVDDVALEELLTVVVVVVVVVHL